MAPYKFEEDIKNTLEKRTIVPSQDAWSALEASLNTSPKKKVVGRFWWLGIAASMVGIALLAFAIFGDQDPISPTIVDTPEKFETPIQEAETPVEVIAQTDAVVPTETPELKEEQVVTVTRKQQVAAIVESNERNEATLVAKTVTKEPVENEVQKVTVVESALPMEAVALNTETSLDSKEAVLDAEVETLLLMAKYKLDTKKGQVTDADINAHLLLLEVEEELDPTFRDKLFNMLKENYQSVKHAVANRNE